MEPYGGAAVVGRDHHGTRETADDGCCCRHLGTGTVDGPGVVVAVVCGGWKW